MYDTSLTATEMIIMITNKNIYLLDCRCNIKRRIDISSLSDIILVKANSSFFALSFLYGQAPLILESFRRAELMVFTLSLRENSNPKPKVLVGDALNLFMKSGKTILLDFDKALPCHAPSKKLEKLTHLDNCYKNASLFGFLDLNIKGFLGKNKWPRNFVVLTNVGLIYFEGNHLDLNDKTFGFVPINIPDFRVVEVDSSEAGGALTVFGLEHGGKRRVTLRCSSLT